MQLTLISPLEHSPEEHNLVAMPDAVAKQQITAVQNILSLRLGEAIWLTPPQALHVTVMEIICHADYGNVSRQDLFEGWFKNYSDTVKSTFAEYAPFMIHFTQLIVSPSAIILKAADSQPLNAIRSELLKTTALPVGTKQPPDITHMSLARYQKAINLETAQQLIGEVDIDIMMHVGNITLMKDLGPPFAPVEESKYQLKQ